MKSKHILTVTFLLALSGNTPAQSNWTGRASGTSKTLNAVTWTGSQLVAVGDSGTILTSQDGIQWMARKFPTAQDLISVIWAGNQLVASGLFGAILTSPDGINWTERANPFSN